MAGSTHLNLLWSLSSHFSGIIHELLNLFDWVSTKQALPLPAWGNLATCHVRPGLYKTAYMHNWWAATQIFGGCCLRLLKLTPLDNVLIATLA